MNHRRLQPDHTVIWLSLLSLLIMIKLKTIARLLLSLNIGTMIKLSKY